MFVTKKDIVEQMASDPDQMAQRYLDAHERIQQLVANVDALEACLRKKQGIPTSQDCMCVS